MEKLKKIIIFIAILILLVIICIITLNYFNSNDKDDIEYELEQNYDVEPFDEEVLLSIEKNTDIEPLKNALYYFVIKDCMQKYLNILNTENIEYYGYDSKGNYTNIISETEKKENIYKLLSLKYIEENKITVDNIYDNINTINESTVFVPIEIKKLIDRDQIKSFAVYGLIANSEDYTLKEYIYAIVNIDENNITFSIEPIKNVRDINEISVRDIDDEISSNEKNIYNYHTILDEDILKEYLDSFKKISIGIPEEIYSRLDEETKNNKFPTVEDYRKYVEENRTEIYNIELSKFSVEKIDNYKQYTLVDKNNKYYIFKELQPMEYTIILK